jgi:Protein of unknown function (DUF3800)
VAFIRVALPVHQNAAANRTSFEGVPPFATIDAVQRGFSIAQQRRAAVGSGGRGLWYESGSRSFTMHFFYLDETGDTGTDLGNAEQPIFVLGGVTVSDKSWRKTTDAVQSIIADFFNGLVPDGFELHAHELVAHQGPFAAHSQEDCNALALALLDVVKEQRHRPHFVAIDKKLLLNHAAGKEHNIIDCKAPYLLAFNYLVSYLERFVREECGKSARGMIIIDRKDLNRRLSTSHAL